MMPENSQRALNDFYETNLQASQNSHNCYLCGINCLINAWYFLFRKQPKPKPR